MRRFWTGLAMAISLAAITAGGVVISQDDSPSAEEAHLWVDTDGGTCTRSSSPATYSSGAACASFSAAYSAASGGDTVRVKTGNYAAPQSIGGTKSPNVNVYGEDGTVVVSGRASSGAALDGFSLSGNVIASNIDVGGSEPFIFIGGDNSTWRDSTMLESSDSNTYPGARGTADGTTPEPILIYTDDEEDPNENLSVINVTVEPQHVCTPGVGDCNPGDVYHLESIRIDQNVNDVLIDSVFFEPGGEDNTATIFLTRPGGGATNPSNITIRNSYFSPNDGSYNIDGGGFGICTNWTLGYNTFTQEVNLTSCQSGSSILFVGNLGPKSTNCSTPGATYTKNMWQWSGDPRCGGSTDSWESGTNFGVDQLEFDSTGHLLSTSPAIDAAETPGASDYCTGALGSVDRDGDTRPAGSVCDVGADER